MGTTTKTYRLRIINALKGAGKYHQSLSVQIEALASAMLTLSKANKDIEGLDTCIIGSGMYVKAHPAFKIQRDAQDSVTKQMKALGLTAEDLDVGDDGGKLAEITAGMIECAGAKGLTLKKKE